MYFYESEGFAQSFDSLMNVYDTRKRIKVVFDELLDEDIEGKKLLDAGCGTGWFSREAVERHAEVYSMDLGPNLLEQVQMKCNSNRVTGSVLDLPFEDDYFDFAVSSEVIEHTPRPLDAIDELYRVLKRNGVLILTTPNRFWFWSVYIANKLHLRPYQGLENWIGWNKLKSKLREAGFVVELSKGVHLFPFLFSWTHPVLDFCHRHLQILKPLMVNMAVRARKP